MAGSMFTNDDHDALMNELLFAIFIPGVIFFVAGWASFRLFFNDVLLSRGLEPLTPAEGYGAIGTGYGRFLLLVVITAAFTMIYIGLYARFFRPPPAKRGWV